MARRLRNSRTVLLLVGLGFCLAAWSFGQESSAPPPTQEPPAAEPSEPPTAAEPPPVPKGVEVLARGPIHEAFATPTTEPQPTAAVSKKPPKPIDELPPEEKPEGNVSWIGGYWAWDDDRKDFLWVSGIWRAPPPGKKWVAGYWRENGDQWQWVPGFWAAAEEQKAESQDITYLPKPPASPATAPPGNPPQADSFYVPGHWVWTGSDYGWRAGYWARVQPGYVWVPAHYNWTPAGYVFVAGYWDMALADRGVMYAPVIVDPVVVGPAFVYTPTYVVRDTVIIDSLWVRPCYCHYYFGDYYGPCYRDYGFESCVVYSRSHYDGVFVYSAWEHRAEPTWTSLQIEVCLARHAGRAPCPPRTLVQQNITNVTNVTNVTNINNGTVVKNINKNTVVNNNQLIVPASQLAKSKGIRTVALNQETRQQARRQAQDLSHVAAQRSQVEGPVAGGSLRQPRQASLKVPALPTSGPASAPMARSASQNLQRSAAGATLSSPNRQPTTNPAAGGAAHTGLPAKQQLNPANRRPTPPTQASPTMMRRPQPRPPSRPEQPPRKPKERDARGSSS